MHQNITIKPQMIPSLDSNQPTMNYSELKFKPYIYNSEHKHQLQVC